MKRKEYCIRGEHGDYGEIYYSKKSLKPDLKHARKHFPNDNFKIYVRKVTDWKEA